MARRQNDLLKPDDIRMPQGPVVDDLPLHILINLEKEKKKDHHFIKSIYWKQKKKTVERIKKLAPLKSI